MHEDEIPERVVRTTDDPGPEFPTLAETLTSLPSLSVNVDFNDLLADVGESEALRMIGDLKDLLA